MNRKPHAQGDAPETKPTTVTGAEEPAHVGLAAAAQALLTAREPRRHIEAMRALSAALRAYQIWQAGA